MTDVTQGADALDENALFNAAVEAETLDKFENPPPVKEPDKPAALAPDGKTEPKPELKPEAKTDDNAPVPPGRLREEAEARRRAERERDDLRAQMQLLARQAPPQQQREQPKGIDLFENPSGFVQQELKPYLENIHTQFQMQREAMSLDFALQRHGEEKVGSARQALEQGMQRGDPHAWSTYQRAMGSHDPYGVIVKWHQDGETLRNIGGDLDGYRKRILEEALADPEYRARVIEAAKGQAAATGQHVARPVKPAVASPSLGNIGAGGGDAQTVEPSDAELFRAATQAKRR
ncbi:hypothetical protein J4G43_024110 [Bradyrhizobium barranii subsp. barranii]|uniref:Uncharacterized protein n=1 Tax=Bradyrhizobium barranii subsp. barranii TaxID=2823807 RepID=A0A939S584_9BRAD|nr:hypothetical protein [Bradyrhizobium barranii]UEM17038.1 hypothetical protein J4G43_024110 [Bradyrhizobium barranii subsp. barranii]